MTQEQKAIALMAERDALLDKARDRKIGFEFGCYVDEAVAADRAAKHILAQLHPLYRPAKWGVQLHD